MASRGQTVTVTYVAWDTSANAGKTADVANHTLRIVKDGTSSAPTNSPAEVDATNAPGIYKLVLTATECTADCVIVCGKSSTANVSIMPITVTFEQLPTAAAAANGGLATVDANNAVKVQAGTGTGQLDFTSGVVKANLAQILGTALTETAGQLAAGFKKFFNVGTPTSTMNQITLVDTTTTNSDMRGTDNAALAATALSNVQWTNARAGYLDNLNVGGAVASQADVAAINLSATKHLTLSSVQQYERPESSSTSYPIECRTYDAETGALVDADSTPALTATGQTSGDLSANLSTAMHVSTGIYRWTYSVASNATNEPLRFDVSATIASNTFTLSHFSQVVDDVSVTWNATNAAQLAALYNKAPAGNIADEALLEAAIALTQQAGSAVTLPTTAPANWIDAAAVATSALDGKGDWAVAGDEMTLANSAVTTAAIADGAITDAKFTVPTEPTGLASGVLSQLNQLWRRFVGNKVTQTSTQIEMYKSDGATVVVTQAVSDDGTTQTQGAGS